MGRGITKGCVEQEHICLQSNKLHALQVTVWGGASNTRRDNILKCENKAGGHLQPHRSQVQGLNRSGKDESHRESIGLSKRDEGLEGQKGKRKDHQSRKSSATANPTHRSLRQVRTNMGRTFSSNRENKVRLIMFGRHRR
jgi:hypothetical protein